MKKIYFSLGLLVAMLFATSTGYAQDKTTEEKVHISIEIDGLACPYCAFGMEKELKKISGVKDVQIELKTGIAYISTPLSQKPSKESLKKIIEDADFTPGEIKYQNHPFEKEE